MVFVKVLLAFILPFALKMGKRRNVDETTFSFPCSSMGMHNYNAWWAGLRMKNKITTKQKRRLPIGISSFKKLRENDYYYIDKTHFIRDIIDASAEALLLPRPRRFGKTLNLSMLRYFFEKNKEDRSGLFDGLIIRNDEVFAEKDYRMNNQHENLSYWYNGY